MGPSPIDSDVNGNQYLLVDIDSFTRYCELKPCKTASAIEAAIFMLENIISHYNIPVEIQTDCGSQFANHLISHLLKDLKIKYRLSVPYRPQSNALVERLNKEIAKAIRSTLLHRIEFAHSWSFAIPFLQRLLDSITHSSTHQPPMLLPYGDKSLHLGDCLLPSNLSSGPAVF